MHANRRKVDYYDYQVLIMDEIFMLCTGAQNLTWRNSGRGSSELSVLQIPIEMLFSVVL